jgi:glycosyltransferase involved in cell wall biosynthesis
VRVAQFLYSGLGGHGSVAFSLIEGDAERRWSNLLGFVGIEPLIPDYRERCEAAGISCAYFAAKEGRPWAVWAAVHRWLRQNRPDAIVCHSGPALLPSALDARRRRVPLIAVEHTSIPARRRAEMLYTRMAMRLADAVVVLTPELASGLRTLLGRAYRDEKVTIIPSGINTDRFHPARSREKRRETTRIGMAGRLTAVKHHDHLIAVVSELQQLRPDRRWTLSIAGDGDERRRLEDLAKDLAPGSVEFTGTLDEQALADWYRTLDVYVHASKAEALSTAILQAMATELPVVASDVPGIAALLPPNAGLLLKNADARAWADAIADLLESEVRMAALARNARELCLRHYGHQRMHRAYDELIRSLVRRHPQAAQ